MTETGPTAPPPEPSPGVPPAVTATWRQAESQLFGSLAMQPELYQQVVRVLAATTDRLRAEARTTAEVLAVRDEMTDVALELAGSLGVALDASQATAIGYTALAIRQREVAAAERASARLERLAAARADGSGWVVLEESGDPAGSPFSPYRRLEADSGSGRALLVRAEPDERFEAMVHQVDPVQVDLGTGQLLQDSSGAEPGPSLPDATAREARAARLRQA